MTSPGHMNNCAQQPKEICTCLIRALNMKRKSHCRHTTFELSYEISTVIHLILVKLPHRGGDRISSAEALAFDVQLLGLADPTWPFFYRLQHIQLQPYQSKPFVQNFQPQRLLVIKQYTQRYGSIENEKPAKCSLVRWKNELHIFSFISRETDIDVLKVIPLIQIDESNNGHWPRQLSTLLSYQNKPSSHKDWSRTGGLPRSIYR